MIKQIILLAGLFISINIIAQKGSITGKIKSNDVPVEYANIGLKGTDLGGTTDAKGKFYIKDIPYGKHTLVISHLSYKSVKKEIEITKNNPNLKVNFNLENSNSLIEQVVVTGTRTAKRQTETPVIVNVLNSQTLKNLQVCNLSESLKFQPGLRVETDCQTCNYTQLRMNGLEGGYSQILINGRPIFSPLTGLYGMEQIPTNMIDRIEVVRGGGSSLYGSSAIGGTVNIITKIPKKSSFEINNNYQTIKGDANDYQTTANATLVNENHDAGISFFINHRERDWYDANGDNFSEIPEIENNSWGANLFTKFSDNQKLELSITNLNEFRYGGEMVEKPSYLALQSEERKHKIWMGSADYQINFNDDNSSFIAYAAWQNTDRKHYTGIVPDKTEVDDYQKHISDPPYGISNTTTYQGGLQINHKIINFLGGTNIFTLGSEYVDDMVFDEIKSYNYKIDQDVTDWGTFIQSDWDITSSLNLLSGIRMDKHNLVDNLIFSPRVALLYKYKKNTQFRLSYGTGFRAPQAFDADMHMAFAGGGVSRIKLADDLKQEKSESWSASINYDRPSDTFIWGFTLEGFYTNLDDAFYTEAIGQDKFGDIFEKRNGKGAVVQGVTFELRANYNRKLQVEAGLTHQSSKYDMAVEPLEGLKATRNFMRTPNDYGFGSINFTPNNKWNFNLNYLYTGTMEIAHAGGADNFTTDTLLNTDAFSVLNAKISRSLHLHKYHSDITFSAGVKNIFDKYQSDFDIGKNRDSNYIYGPQQPRTFFIGITIKSE